MRTAFLIDGGFFLKRYRRLCGGRRPDEVATALHRMCLDHLRDPWRGAPNQSELYRIFYYDCPPIDKKVHNPITGKALDFSKTALSRWRQSFFEELKKRRKVAVRMGYLAHRSGHWDLSQDALKRLLRKEITIDDLTEDDVRYAMRQKGVDMRIGLDIASLAYKTTCRTDRARFRRQ